MDKDNSNPFCDVGVEVIWGLKRQRKEPIAETRLFW
jgi:hypothetical protein